MFDTMRDDLVAEFATGLAKQALGDLEGAFDRALTQAHGGRQARALANLREKSVHQLKHIAAGRNDRLPSAVLDDALEGISRILHGDSKEAIAKAASGPGRREAMHTLESDGMSHDPLRDRASTTDALVAIGREFADLVKLGEKAAEKLGAGLQFATWRSHHHCALATLLRVGDLRAAEEEMARARRALNHLLDEAQRDAALGKAASSEAAPLIQNFHH